MRREICISFQIIQLSAGILSTDLFAREKPTRTLRFVADVFPDLVEEVDHERICGPVPYLAKTATESLGYRYEVELLPLARALKSIRTGSRDGIIGIYKNEERDGYIRYTKRPVYTDTIRVFTQKKTNMNWNGSLDSLKSARIGVMLGWYYTDRFRKLEKDDPRFRFEWIPLRESGFKMLRAQRIDVLISNDRNYQNFQENVKSSSKAAAEAQDLLPLEPPLETKGIYIGFARQVPSDVIQSFDKALDQLLKETRFQEKLPDPKTLCPAP